MSTTSPIITFRVTVASAAAPDRVYAVLADLNTHLLWSGEQAPDKNFRLITMVAPSARAGVGDRFSSTGDNGFSMTFSDSSIVVTAEPGSRFGFDTESHLARKHRPAWQARFAHRFTLTGAGDGTMIAYRCDVWPQNYIPWWLHPALRPMTRVMVQRATAKNMQNLARMAEAVTQGQG